MVKKPFYKYVPFADKAGDAAYLPVEFATNKQIHPTEWFKVANDNYAYGLESAEGELELRDLNSVLFYQGKAQEYLFQQGVPEFNEYQDYPTGAVLTFNGKLFITKHPIEGKKIPTHVKDVCGNTVTCGCEESECDKHDPVNNPEAYCELACKEYVDAHIKDLQDQIDALQKAITDLAEKTVIEESTDKFTINNFDGSSVEIQKVKVTNGTDKLSIKDNDGVTVEMTKAKVTKTSDKFTIRDNFNNTVEIPVHKAEEELVDASGTMSHGYFHTGSDM